MSGFAGFVLLELPVCVTENFDTSQRCLPIVEWCLVRKSRKVALESAYPLGRSSAHWGGLDSPGS